jgi:hypothetical protein
MSSQSDHSIPKQDFFVFLPECRSPRRTNLVVVVAAEFECVAPSEFVHSLVIVDMLLLSPPWPDTSIVVTSSSFELFMSHAKLNYYVTPVPLL